MNMYLRKEEILNYIRERKICGMEELLKTFKVSVSTLHRDLNILKQEGRINKYYGKVTLKEEKDFYQSRMQVNVALKRRIAKKALEFIENGDCLFFDNSTTVFYLGEALCESYFKNITVVSNSALLLNLFLKNRDIEFIATGGKLDKDFNCFIGPQALRAIHDFNGSKFFFSTSSISLDGGISDIYFPDEMSIKESMFRRSQKSFLLVDSTKFGKISTTKWFDPYEITCIITDRSISQERLREFKDTGIELVIA